MTDNRWYAIQTTAGHENKVRSLIDRRIKDDPRPDEEKPIRQALVPTQEQVEIKNGKKVTVERKIYPGYVLVNMVLNQETIHVINGIQGVIKFVGTGRMPMPLRSEEVNRLLGIEEAVKEEEPQEHIPFLVGQVVEITEGPFSDVGRPNSDTATRTLPLSGITSSTVPEKSENGPSEISTTWPIRNGMVSCGSSSFTASSMPSRRFTSSGRSGIGSRPVPTNLITPWMPLIVWSVSC